MLTAKQLVCILEAGLTRRNFLSTLSRAAAAAGLGAGTLTPGVVTQLAKAVSPKNRLTLATIFKMQQDASHAAYELTNRWLEKQKIGGKPVGWYYARKDPVIQRVHQLGRKADEVLNKSKVKVEDLVLAIRNSPAYKAEYAAITDDEIDAAAKAEDERLRLEYDEGTRVSELGDELGDDDYDYGIEKPDKTVPRYSGDDVVVYNAIKDNNRGGDPAEINQYREEYKQQMATARAVAKSMGTDVNTGADFINMWHDHPDNTLVHKVTFDDLAAKGLITPEEAAKFEEQSMQVVAFTANQQKELERVEKEISGQPITVVDPEWHEMNARHAAQAAQLDPERLHRTLPSSSADLHRPDNEGDLPPDDFEPTPPEDEYAPPPPEEGPVDGDYYSDDEGEYGGEYEKE
jgi:hypothetical protein